MSVCAHDPYCPGHGPHHDEALGIPDHRGYKPGSIFYTPPRQVPIRNSKKDRSLSGKDRIRTRKEARR